MMKRLSGLTAFLVMVLPLFGQGQANVPHFFPAGITQTSDPAEQWELYLKYIMATDHCQGLVGTSKFVSGGKAIRKVVKINGRNMTLVLDPYVRNSDGTIVFTSYCGQEVVTEAQLKTVQDYIVQQQTLAADLNWAFYNDVEKLAVAARAKKLGRNADEFSASLDKPSRYPDISVREEHLLPPTFEKADFVTNELHLGYFPDAPGSGILGAAWLNSGTVYITMQMLALDYLVGQPVVLMHENVHSNEKLQSLPLSEGFNTELFASIPEALMPEDKIHLWFHGYVEPLRELIWVHFGFDFKQAKKEIVRGDLAGNIFIDKEKFNKYTALLDKAKPVMLAELKKALVEFYSDAPGWVAFNDKLQNDYAVMDLMFAKDFDICVRVTDKATCEAAMKWLKANDDKIREMAKKSFEESGTGDSSGGMSADKRFQRFEPMVGTLKALYPQVKESDITAFLSKEGLTLKDLMKMDDAQLMTLFKKFLSVQKGGR